MNIDPPAANSTRRRNSRSSPTPNIELYGLTERVFFYSS